MLLEQTKTSVFVEVIANFSFMNEIPDLYITPIVCRIPEKQPMVMIFLFQFWT